MPSNVKYVKSLLNQEIKEKDWQRLNDNYKAMKYAPAHKSKQTWTLYFSPESYKSSLRTLTNKVSKALEKEQIRLNKLCRQTFACMKDAKNAVNLFNKALVFHQVDFTISEVEAKRKKRGRPAKDEPKLMVYQLVGELVEDKDKLAPKKVKLGRFVLATNDEEGIGQSAQSMLDTYKEQTNVERGFAFIKSDEFQLDHVFLKRPERIDALMMIMALTVLVYNSGQYLMRAYLKEQNETLPNQLGKEIQTPTLR